MRKLITGILFSLALPVAFAHSQEFVGEASKALTPYEAIQLAAADPANGVTGVFEFEVRGSGKDKRFVYLNSEKDYRDQRCLTVTLARGNAASLGRKLGLSLQSGLIGKHVRVQGTAKRERIVITSSGRSTGLYYYQTHIYVGDPDQVQVLDGA